jgi:hypothetical protein
MRRTILHIATSLLLIFTVQVSLAQSNYDAAITQLQQDVASLKSANNKLKIELQNQKTDFAKQLKDSTAKIKSELQQNEQNINSINQQLGIKITATENNANQKIKTLDDTIGKSTLYWIIAVLTIALLSVLLFGLLRKQLTKNKTDITANIQQTKKALEEEGVKLDSKLADLLATQMLLMKEERQAVPSSKADEVNHELALKVADEIIRIQKNLGNMDAETKGLKQLSASVIRIQDNFKAKGYEMIDMLNKPYDLGMKVSANFIPDEALKAGEQIITRIIKPQVNFNGVMIQSAQIEVSQGE